MPTIQPVPVETVTVNGMGMGPRSILALSGSPASVQNTSATRLVFFVSLGTVSAIEFSRDNVTFDLVGLLAGSFILNPGDWLRITYAVAPTIIYYPV